MWIKIKKDIFDSSDFKGLNFLLQILTWYPSNSIPRYNVFINTSKVGDSLSYKNLSEIDKKIIETEFDEAITKGIKNGNYLITNRNDRPNTFKIEEAIMFLTQPVYIVIENSLNDSYFLKTIFQHFDKKIDGSKRKLIEFVQNNWIEFVNAGGWTNIDNYITGKLVSYSKLSNENAKENYNYLRCFVMMDSDKKHPTDTVTTVDKESLKTSLEAKNIKVHILKKRAMENYMPDEVIENLPDIKREFNQFRAWTNVYKHLNNYQKDFLDYRKGFLKKDDGTNRNTLDINIQNLYPLAQISENNFNILDDGLNQFPKFKDNFPKLFENNPLVHKTSLLNREGGTNEENEFLEIIEAIKSLL